MLYRSPGRWYKQIAPCPPIESLHCKISYAEFALCVAKFAVSCQLSGIHITWHTFQQNICSFFMFTWLLLTFFFSFTFSWLFYVVHSIFSKYPRHIRCWAQPCPAMEQLEQARTIKKTLNINCTKNVKINHILISLIFLA